MEVASFCENYGDYFDLDEDRALQMQEEGRTTGSDGTEARAWYTIVHNDDINPFNDVVDMLGHPLPSSPTHRVVL